jgi:two-component system sensor histidine kinase GlrK
VADELLQLPLEPDQLAALKRTMLQEATLYQVLVKAKRVDRRKIGPLAAELSENASEVLAISTRVADREVQRLRIDAESVQRQLVLLVLFSTALALAIALALTRHVVRPIAQLDTAIRQLGSADFSQPIAVRGPDDLKTLGERLDWLRRRLAELEAEKNRFLRHLSHELKTPLTALREGAELLHDEIGGPLSSQQRKVVVIMKDNSIKLQRLIEALLDYQRALHASASLEVRSVSLRTVVHEAAQSHELAAQAKGLRVAIDAEPATLEADPDKLRSIFDNLIGNAIKFTPAGGSVSVLARSSGDQTLIDVIDSGPGVPAEEREAIFDSFFRGTARAGARVEGSGLGLAIVREFVEAHGGKISVLAEARGGHFRVALPRRIAA